MGIRERHPQGRHRSLLLFSLREKGYHVSVTAFERVCVRIYFSTMSADSMK